MKTENEIKLEAENEIKQAENEIKQAENEIKLEIEKVLYDVGLTNFCVEIICYDHKAFGNFVVDMKSDTETLRIINDRSQLFLYYWLDEKEDFVYAADVYPELRTVYSKNKSETGLGVWTLEDLLKKWAQR